MSTNAHQNSKRIDSKTAELAHDLTRFQLDLLVALRNTNRSTSRPSGQDVKHSLEQAQLKEIHHGRLYPNLDRLIDNDLVEKGELDRRTNYYAITAKGRAVLEYREGWIGGDA